jgi:transposase-like protein
MSIRDELLDELLKEYKNPEDLFGKDGIFKELKKRLIEKAMDTEITHHLGYEKHSPSGKNTGNSRNGKSSKIIKSNSGEIPIEVPRDRNGSFEPRIVKKNQTWFDGFDEKIISMYARGMTTRDIQAHLEVLYGVEVSPDLISPTPSKSASNCCELQLSGQLSSSSHTPSSSVSSQPLSQTSPIPSSLKSS